MKSVRLAPAGPRPGDSVYLAPAEVTAKLPASVDLRTAVAAADWPIWDQGRILSCTAHAVAGVALYEMLAAKRSPVVVPSRLFLYYNERRLDGDADSLAASYVSDGIDVVVEQGFCADVESPGVVPADAVWKYSTDAKLVETKPPESCYRFAKGQRGFTYQRVHADPRHQFGCLAEGHPFTILISMCSWGRISAKGDIPMPTSEERAGADGGTWHAMVIVGYDHATRLFIVRNSMGAWRGQETGWGDAGHGTIPYEFIADKTISDPHSMFTLRVKPSHPKRHS